MNFETIRCTINTAFLSALINGDYSGLSLADEEDETKDCKLVEEYEREMVRIHGPGHWAIPEYDAAGDPNDEPSFMECEVCGLYAPCVEVHYMARRN